MPRTLEAVKELLQQVASERKKGDALRKVGQEDRARRAYEAGLARAEQAVDLLLQPPYDALPSAEPPLSTEHEQALLELVEACGVRGGLLQRLTRIPEALTSYKEGGELEAQFQLPGTYNRLNALRCTLLSGAQHLDSLQPQLQDLAEIIEEQLRSDPKCGDSGWAWADLGDVHALLGQLDQAQTAYATFMDKSETKSPERTLEVLGQIAVQLQRSGDPGAVRLHDAIEYLRGRLQGVR